jgi:tetratricopeptide (TPR) repeat protein
MQSNNPGPEENIRQAHARVDWFDTGRLLGARADSPMLETSPKSSNMRGQSWLMAHKAFVDDEKFRESIFKYLEAINSFTPVDKAVQQSFGMSVADLDRIIYGYARRTNFALTTINYAPVEATAPGGGTPIASAALFETLASLALDSGAELKHLDELIAAAQGQGLDAPRVQLLKLRLAAQAGDDAALESLLGKLKESLADPAVARSAGIALFERGGDASDRNAAMSPAAFERLSAAQDLLGRSLAAKGDDAQAAWIYGVIAARLSRDVDGALRQLDRARNSQPENPDVAAALASLHFLRNDREAMLARLRDTLRYSRSGDQRRWAARQIASGNPDLTPSMK